jgi:hypothetical protein
MNTDNPISAPQLSLPKGGGAIKGIGETFSGSHALAWESSRDAPASLVDEWRRWSVGTREKIVLL